MLRNRGFLRSNINISVSNNYVEGVTGKGSSAAFILRMGPYPKLRYYYGR